MNKIYIQQLLEDIQVEEELDAQTNSFGTPILLHFFLDIRRISKTSWRRPLCWKREMHLILKKKLKLLTHTRWTSILPVEALTKHLNWNQDKNKLELHTMIPNQYWVSHSIKKASLIGKMVIMMFSMKNIPNTLSTPCHLKEILITNRISLKNNRENWENTMTCSNQ